MRPAVVGIPGLDGYFASRDGRIWTTHSRGRGPRVQIRLIKGTIDKNGYRVIAFSGRPARRFAHQLVLEAYRGMRPRGFVSRHLDGNPINNRLKNLCWSTQKENLSDKIRHGTHNRGSAHASAKLTEKQVAHIRRLVSKLSHSAIASRFGVSRGTIQRIIAGKRWRHVR